MNSCDLVAAVTAISCAIAKCVSKEELALLTAVFGQLAATLGTLAVQMDTDNGTTQTQTPPVPEPDEAAVISTGTSSPSGSSSQ